MIRVSLILASTRCGIIGLSGKLPWHIPEDMRHFSALTTGHAVIMGRKTYDDIGKPLPRRHNVVVTSRPSDIGLTEGLDTAESVDVAITKASAWSTFNYKEELFVIGGASIYEALLPRAGHIYWTTIDPYRLPAEMLASNYWESVASNATRWQFDRSRWWVTGTCAGRTPGVEFVRLERRVR